MTPSWKSNWDFKSPLWEQRVISDLLPNLCGLCASSMPAHERVTGVSEATELLCQASAKDSQSLEMMIYAFLKCSPGCVPSLKAMWETPSYSQYPAQLFWHMEIFAGVPYTFHFAFSSVLISNSMYLFLPTSSNCINYTQRKDITVFCSSKIIVIFKI